MRLRALDKFEEGLIQITVRRNAHVFHPGTQREAAMMTLNDCATLCVLDHEDIAAIAEFEHVPEVADATLGIYLANPACDGSASIAKAMICDIRSALDDGFVHHATEVVMALRHFLEQNPQAAPGVTKH